jgi:hypothetical protein
MKHTLLLMLVFTSCICSYAQTPFSRKLDPEKYEGDKPYTPTRIEWLLVEYRNECSVWLGGIPTLSWSLYAAYNEKNRINIKVQFDDEAVRAKAKRGAETCERNILALAKDRGWTWLTTKIELGNRNINKNPNQ